MPEKADLILSVQMQGIAEALDSCLAEFAGERVGFLLITFPFNRTGRCGNYVSNAQRAGMETALRELLDEWTQGAPDVPLHQRGRN